MFSRLFFLFRDQTVSLKKTLYMSALQVLLLFVFKPQIFLIIFILLLIGTNFLLFIVEKKHININLIRFLSLVLLIILTGLFTSGNSLINFSQSLIDFIIKSSGYFLPSVVIKSPNWLFINIVAAGFLFLLNEVNFVIRYFFEALSVVPKITDKEGNELEKENEKEYNAGRVIGMLERILIMFFVLVNQLGAIGFIIAAKGFTRFKELDNRDFAEYVLIGTLLSSLFAIAVALLIKQLATV
jgi:hypothetical protein